MSVVKKRRKNVSVASTSSSGDSVYIDHGDCHCVCRHCGAIFWFDERIVSQSTRNVFVYNRCCKGGRVALPAAKHPPEVIVSLYDDIRFLVNIRAFNSICKIFGNNFFAGSEANKVKEDCLKRHLWFDMSPFGVMLRF
ncbi:hypothetical protein QVD17_15670 [Tagetes erecta]|uniref:Uncharacterized protein n=1 Tax=Tagetes erecta TaxID=13708 RepID=A0AAD8KQ88_TARER|nr:hypothetical protein QVD17_15670 [Tagetes erecta]